MVGIITMAGLALAIGLALSLAHYYLRPDHASLTEKVNQLLPQTQCGQCGYPGCRPYANAIAVQQAPINQCPPGGEALISELAGLLNRTPEPLNPQYGTYKPPTVAVIDESQCIGCALCLPACPVDAIVGAPKYLHRIIADQCTGCELCISPCPVDCIEMADLPLPQQLPTPITPAKPCIRCDRCTQICPVGLDVQTLFHRVRSGDYSEAQNLMSCIECNACEEICPSEIRLMDYHRFGKQEIRRQFKQRREAERAGQYSDAKLARLALQKHRETQFFSDRHTALKAEIQAPKSPQSFEG